MSVDGFSHVKLIERMWMFGPLPTISDKLSLTIVEYLKREFGVAQEYTALHSRPAIEDTYKSKRDAEARAAGILNEDRRRNAEAECLKKEARQVV